MNAKTLTVFIGMLVAHNICYADNHDERISPIDSSYTEVFGKPTVNVTAVEKFYAEIYTLWNKTYPNESVNQLELSVYFLSRNWMFYLKGESSCYTIKKDAAKVSVEKISRQYHDWLQLPTVTGAGATKSNTPFPEKDKVSVDMGALKNQAQFEALRSSLLKICTYEGHPLKEIVISQNCIKVTFEDPILEGRTSSSGNTIYQIIKEDGGKWNMTLISSCDY